jgi:PAS domain S-box-containing protein
MTAALEFNDPRSASETLASLRSEANLVAAFLYDRSGMEFASYHRAGSAPIAAPPRETGSVHTFTADSLRLFRPIVNQSEEIGTIVVVSDLSQLSARLSRYTLIVVLVFGVSLLLAVLLSRYFERLLTRPILNLAALTRTVAVEKNYSGRAAKESDDEIGGLIDGFNHMLAQLEARDAELVQAHALLERRVAERTIDLQRSQEETAREQARFKLIFDSVPVGIALAGIRSGCRELWLINDAYLQICGLTREQAMAVDLFRGITHPADLERQLELARQLESAAIRQFTVEKRFLTPGGRTVWVVFSVQRRHTGCDYYEDLCTAVDITARKQAEAERENLHRRLMDASHQAGMAEVATGVLHNVGNVLNSVNVSATLVSDQLRHTKLPQLARVCGLLRQHEQDLEAFLSRDPRGRQVLGFLEALAEELTAEQANLSGEINSLRLNIDHIRDIVAMQQGNARTIGVVETVALVDLIEDAARINLGALVRHGVVLQRDFQIQPSVSIEKHKLLQILINLIRNASEACIRSERSDKLITLRLTGEAKTVTIAVADNGVGIPAENLTRIFHHGFTTRTDGHGFGLHSAALAARQLGGTISVESGGPGLGATFFVALPLKPAADPP